MNIYNYAGQDFTEDQIEKRATSKGLSLQEYLNQNPEITLVSGKEQGSTEDPTMSQESMGSQSDDGFSASYDLPQVDVTADKTESQEDDTWIERTLGKNFATDFLGDLWRAGEQGMAQGATVDEAFDVYKKGKDISDEELRRYIEVSDALDKTGVSDEMREYEKIKEEAGGGVWGFMKGMVMTRGQVIPQVIVSSAAAMGRTFFDSEEAALAAGGGAAVAGAAGSVVPIVGTATGAIGGAIAGLTGSMETALTLTELLKTELGDKDFNKENIRAILEDEELFEDIKDRALARGATIGAVEGITVGLSRGVGAKLLAKGASKGKIARQVTGIETLGGSGGEALGQVAAGQEFDIAEVLMEGVAEAKGVVNVADILAKKEYKINGEKRTRKEVLDKINNTKPESLAEIQFDITGDKNLDNLVRQKQGDAIFKTQIDERVEEADRNKLVELEKKRLKAEADKKKKGIFAVPGAETTLENIEGQIAEIIGRYEGVDRRTSDVRARKKVAGEVRAGVAERDFQANMAFAKKHSELYGLKFTELTQEEVKKRFENTENSGLVNSLGGIIGDEIIINKDLAKTRVYGDNVGNHELLHGIIKASKANITQETINDFLNIIGEDNKAIIQKRIDENYDADYMSKNLDEYFTIFSDAIANNEVKFNDNVFTKIADVIRRMFASFGIAKVDFESGRGAYNFLKDYNKSIHKGTLSKGVKAKASDVVFEEAKDSRSKLVDTINDLQQGATTRANFQKPEIFNKVFEAVQSGGAINNYIRSLGMSTEKTQETIDAVTDRLINFDPAAKRKDGTTIGPRGLGEFIMANVGFGKLEAAKKLAVEGETRKRTTRIDDPDVKNIPDDTPAPTTKTETKTKKTVIAEKLGITKEVAEAINKIVPNLDINKLNFKTLKNQIPEITGKLFGISTKKIEDLSNLSKPELQAAQMFISKNAPLLIAMLPKGATISGTSTGVPNTLLAAFYTKTAKAKLTKTGSRAGLPIQVKNKNITPKKFLETFGIIDGKPMRDDRNTSARVLALANLTGKMISNQAVRQELSQTSEKVTEAINKIKEGKSDIMFSKSYGNKVLEKSKLKPVSNQNVNDRVIFTTFIEEYLPLFVPVPRLKSGKFRLPSDTYGPRSKIVPGYYITRFQREISAVKAGNVQLGNKIYTKEQTDQINKAYSVVKFDESQKQIETRKKGAELFIKGLNEAVNSKKGNKQNLRPIQMLLGSTPNGTYHIVRMIAPGLGVTNVGKASKREHVLVANNAADIIIESLAKDNINLVLPWLLDNYYQINVNSQQETLIDNAYKDSDGKAISKEEMPPIFYENLNKAIDAKDMSLASDPLIRYTMANVNLSEINWHTGGTLLQHIDAKYGFDGALSYGNNSETNVEFVNKRLTDFFAKKTDKKQTKKAIENISKVKFKQKLNSDKTFNDAVKASRSSKESKGISILDFDDTLATTKSLVKYTTPDGETGTLNAEQFASTYQDLQDQGYTFDFSDFNKVVKGKLAPLFNKAIKLQGKFGPENMFVLTARPPQAAKAIFDFLKANGLNIPLKNITGLGNSTSEAKALWVADKVGEGYNDFYFADDALQNVQAVKNMLDQFDVKSKVQQARVKFSKSMNDDFNNILEEVTGIDAKKRFSEIKARKRGASKGKFRLFIPPSHEDFVGLLYNFMGKGKKGDQHRNFFEQALVKPLNRAYREIDTAKQAIANDYKSLNKQFPEVKKKLTKETLDGDFTFQDAIRVYLWNKHGYDIPGLTKTDQAKLVELVMNDADLVQYAETLNVISKQDTYVDPGPSWETGNIRIDLIDATGRVGRAQYFTEFNENAEVIFSPENLNKIEAAYGKDFREALEDMLHAIKTGINRPKGANAKPNMFLNWLNASVSGVMFFNTRSSILQQMSIVNYINFADNNMYAAGKAFANQSQYWKDWAFIFNSDMLKQRRGGIGTDINGAELAEAVKKARPNNLFDQVAIITGKLLKLGFLPTQIGDNIAIATGGATFYRNRINKYIKDGMSKKEAEAAAFTDFQNLTQSTQQSSRPDMTSQQQRSWIGKFVLNFQNITSQYNRIIKKAALDIYNRRITPPYTTQTQSDLGNLSKILYYGGIQNVLFYSLQTALFAVMFDDDEDEDQILKKKERVINGTIDSILRGSGIYGAVASTLKNMIIKFNEQREKGYNKDESAVLMEALNFSPIVGIRARGIVSGEKTLNYSMPVIKEMETFDIDNPMWSAVTNYIQVAGFPANRLYQKSINMRNALNTDYTNFQRALFFSGYTTWSLGLGDPEAVIEAKEKVKINKKNTKKKSKNKTKATSAQDRLKAIRAKK